MSVRTIVFLFVFHASLAAQVSDPLIFQRDGFELDGGIDIVGDTVFIRSSSQVSQFDLNGQLISATPKIDGFRDVTDDHIWTADISYTPESARFHVGKVTAYDIDTLTKEFDLFDPEGFESGRFGHTLEAEGDWVAVGNLGRYVLIYDDSAEIVHSFSSEEFGGIFHLSIDHDSLALSTTRNNIEITDLTTGDLETSINGPEPLFGNFIDMSSERVFSLADSETVYGFDRTGRQVGQVAKPEGTHLFNWMAAGDSFLSVAWSASESRSTTVFVYDNDLNLIDTVSQADDDWGDGGRLVAQDDFFLIGSTNGGVVHKYTVSVPEPCSRAYLVVFASFAAWAIRLPVEN